MEVKLAKTFDAWLAGQLSTADIRVTPLLSLAQPAAGAERNSTAP